MYIYYKNIIDYLSIHLLIIIVRNKNLIEIHTKLNKIQNMNYIENNAWVRGNTKFISSVERDILRVSAANE